MIAFSNFLLRINTNQLSFYSDVFQIASQPLWISEFHSYQSGKVKELRPFKHSTNKIRINVIDIIAKNGIQRFIYFIAYSISVLDQVWRFNKIAERITESENAPFMIVFLYRLAPFFFVHNQILEKRPNKNLYSIYFYVLFWLHTIYTTSIGQVIIILKMMKAFTLLPKKKPLTFRLK